MALLQAVQHAAAAVGVALAGPGLLVAAAAALARESAAAESPAPQVERMLIAEGRLASGVGVTLESRLCLRPALALVAEAWVVAWVVEVIEVREEWEVRLVATALLAVLRCLYRHVSKHTPSSATITYRHENMHRSTITRMLPVYTHHTGTHTDKPGADMCIPD